MFSVQSVLMALSVAVQNKKLLGIKFLTYGGIKPVQIFPRLKVAYGDKIMNVNKVQSLGT